MSGRVETILVSGARTFKPLMNCEVCGAQTYYQPAEDANGLHASGMLRSFEVYASLETGKAEHPDVSDWWTLHGDDVEGPMFMDCPYRHEGEIDEVSA